MIDDLENLRAWAIRAGYDPARDYVPKPALEPGQLSPHFRESEFACRCCGEIHPDGVPRALVDLLERVRERFGPVHITSGYRCPKHNKAVGGAEQSQHMLGTAADIVARGATPADVYRFIDQDLNHGGGLGSYKSFTHVDVRDHKTRWAG